MGLSGVLGRPIYALSCGKDKRVRPYDVSAPFTWGDKIEGAPLLLAHVSNFHYCPVKVLEGGEWNFVLAPVEERKDPAKWKECRFLADDRLVVHWTEAERGNESKGAEPGGGKHQVNDKGRHETRDVQSRCNAKKNGGAPLRAKTFPPLRPSKEDDLRMDGDKNNVMVENEAPGKLDCSRIFQGRSSLFTQQAEGLVSFDPNAGKVGNERAWKGGGRELSCGTHIGGSESRRGQEFQGRNHARQRPEKPAPSKASAAPLVEEPARSEVGNSGRVKQYDFQNVVSTERREKEDDKGQKVSQNELCGLDWAGKSRRDQDLQGRNHPFDQRPERPVPSEPELPEKEVEKREKTESLWQDVETAEHQDSQRVQLNARGTPADEAHISFSPLIRRDDGDRQKTSSSELDDTEKEAGRSGSQVLQGRIHSFDQRPGGHGLPEPTLPRRAEQDDQWRGDIERLEDAMTALHLGVMDSMDIEEEEERGDG